MPKQVKAALTAAFIVFVVAVTGGMAVGSIGLFGAGAGALGLATLSFATTLVTSLIGGMGSKGIEASSGNFGTKIAQRNGIAPRQLIYGEARVGGTIVHMSTSGTDNNLLHMVIVLAGHEVESLQSVMANDTTLTTSTSTINGETVHTVSNSKYVNTENDNAFTSGKLMRFTFEDGSQTTANGFATAQCPSLGSTDKYLGCAYVYFQMVYDSEKIGGAVPGLAFIMRGKKVFDPRDSSTSFSANPALCIRDYLQDTLYGLKAKSTEINDTSFGAAANICDQTVTLANGSSTETRYTCNGFSNFAADGGGLLEAMLSSMAGSLTYTNGRFNILAGGTQTPTLTVTDDNLLSPLKVSTGGGTGALYNAIKPVFVDSSVNFQAADGQIYEDSTFLAEDTPSSESSANYKKQLEVQLPFTTSKTMAERIARIALISQRQTASVSLLTDLKFMRLQPGDWVYFTNERLGYDQKLFEVLGTNMELAETEGSDTQIVATRLELKETSTAVFDFGTSDYTPPTDEGGGTDDGDNSVSVPSSLALTQQLSVEGSTTKADIKVSWTNASNDLIVGTEIQYKLSTDGDYTSDLVVGKGVSTGLIPNVVVGLTYNVRLKHIASTGVSSAYTSAVNITITSTTAPSVPTNWNATSAKFGILLNWTNPPETNFRAVKIYRKTTNSNPTNDNSVVATMAGDPGSTGRDVQNIADNLVAGTTYYFWIRSINHLGVQSALSSSINATFTAGPSDIGILSLADVDSDQDTKLNGVESGATLGATAGTNIKDSGNNTLGDEDIRNSDLDIDFTGNTTFRLKKGSTVINSQSFSKTNVGLSDLDSLESGTGTKLGGIEAGATLGATAGTNLKDSGNNTLGDEDVRNDDLSLAFSGTNVQLKKGTTQIGSNVDAPDALKNANTTKSDVGLANVTNDAQIKSDGSNAPNSLKNAQITLAKDGSGNLSLDNAGSGNVSFDNSDVGLGNVTNDAQIKTDGSNAPNALKNNQISISSAGVLSNAGGGTVSASGLGAVKTDLTNAPTTIVNSNTTKSDVGLANVTNDAQVKSDGSNAPNILKNDQVSINSDGTLTGAGSGQVTVSGIGAITPADAQTKVDNRLSTTEKTRLNAGSSPDNSKSFDNSAVDAAHVGLGNVTNESKATMFTGPTFTGTVAGVSSTHVGLGNVTNDAQVKSDGSNAPNILKNDQITLNLSGTTLGLNNAGSGSETLGKANVGLSDLASLDSTRSGKLDGVATGSTNNGSTIDTNGNITGNISVGATMTLGSNADDKIVVGNITIDGANGRILITD